MEKRNIEEALKDHLEKVGLGYPRSDAFIELLRLNLTDEELEVILGLPTKVAPFEVEDIDTIGKEGKRTVFS